MANPNSSAQRSFAAEPYDSVAAVLASKQLTGDLGNKIIYTKDGHCYHIPEDQGVTDWHVQTAGGAKMYVIPVRNGFDVRAFGALGDGSQELISTSYWTDVSAAPVQITQQTKDAVAINSAIRALRSSGGGRLYIPKGEFRVWGYLERIDFPCLITGDGVDQTIIKNCDASPTNANGYGIFCVDARSTSASEIGFHNLTLNGNADVRIKPTSEWRSYNIAWYGSVVGRVSQVKSINSPIDCFYTNYENEEQSSMQVSNCTFDNSFRNTVSLVSGWNQYFANCYLGRGGYVHGGTNPRYCLDIEPNSGSRTIRNISFVNCTIQDAKNVLAGGIWAGNVKFSNCTFRVTEQGTAEGYPWVGNWRGGEFTFIGCSFEDKVGYRNRFKCDNPVSTGEFVGKEFVRVKSCSFEGVGFEGHGANMFVIDTEFTNSLWPFVLRGLGRQNAIIRGVTLINLFDVNNVNGGDYSSFTVDSTFEGNLDIDGVHARVVPEMLPAGLNVFRSSIYGITIRPVPAGDAEVRIINVHASGYSQKYPTMVGVAPNASSYRDWRLPTLPPADTSGQTAGPGTIFYKGCTQYGNSP